MPKAPALRSVSGRKGRTSTAFVNPGKIGKAGKVDHRNQRRR
jgi:hypothetical protein